MALPVSVRALARVVIRELVKTDPSINRAVSILRGQGLGYRYQNMRRDLREALDWHRNQDEAMRVPGSRTMPESLMVSSYNMPSKARYRIFGEITIADPVTGEPRAKLVSYYSDINLTADEEKEELEEHLRNIGSGYAQTVLDFKRIIVMHNPDLGHRSIESLFEI